MKNISKYIGLGFYTMLAMTACSDQFLEDKTNYDNVGEAVYDERTEAQQSMLDARTRGTAGEGETVGIRFLNTRCYPAKKEGASA